MKSEGGESSSNSCEAKNSNVNDAKKVRSPVVVKTRKQKGKNITSAPEFARMKWMENEGVELFDILGEEKLREKVSKSVKYLPDRYDKSFYGDQKSTRKDKIVNRINEYYVEEKK